MEEKYTLEQIVDAITQAEDELVCAIQYRDRDAVEDVMRQSVVTTKRNLAFVRWRWL